MKTVYVVVADEAIARILEWPETGDELVPVEELTDPAAHAQASDLRRDAYGRRSGGSPPTSANPGGVQSLRGGSSATSSAGEAEQHLEAEGFAKRVAERLHALLTAKRYAELRVAAAPRFLGLLRKAFSSHVAATVTRELNKDLIHCSNRELTDRLIVAQKD